jgi:hypothetical protein
MNPKTRYSKSLPWSPIAIAVVGLLLAAQALADNPVPQVVGPVKPQAVVPGSAEFTLTVYGANFVSGAVVNWNGQPRSTTFISARELQAQILASNVAKPTAGYITVTNPPPGGGKSSSSYAIVEVHQPTKTIAVNQPGVYLLKGDPFYAVTADVTGDGKLDLVTGVGSGQLALNRGNGDGTFQAGLTIGNDYYANAGIGFGDFNGDGKIDLAYGWGTTVDPPTYIKVLLGEGGDKFHGLPRFDFLADSYVKGITAADFNRDGKLDLAFGYTGPQWTGGLFLGNGDGTFQHAWKFYSGGGDVVVADFNGDGKPDVAMWFAKNVYLWLGNGDGTFQKGRVIESDKYDLGCSFGPALVVNDFNGDGNPDLAFCDRSYNSTGRIGILLGKGDGTFQKPVYYSTRLGTGNLFSFTAGDFNSDCKTDLIAATPGQNNSEFVVFWGNGDGTFQKAKKINLPDNGGGDIGLVPGDFNSDGMLDFVIVDPVGLEVYTQK